MILANLSGTETTNSDVVNALSVDVEDYYHVTALSSVVSRHQWESLPSRVVDNTHRVLELLESSGAKATFFILGWVAERNARLVRTIADAGHEIACHGYSHKRINEQDAEEFRSETRRAKEIIEDSAGKAVLGYRAASFSITKDSLWALDILVEEGFVYDSSIFPIHHDLYGVPGASGDPGTLTTPGEKTLAEFPLSALKILGINLPVGGGGYFRLYPYWFTELSLKAMNRHGRCFNFYCHPWEFDPDQPRFDNVPLLSRFRHYNNLSLFESRFKRLLNTFSFSTCIDVLRRRGIVSDC